MRLNMLTFVSVNHGAYAAFLLGYLKVMKHAERSGVLMFCEFRML
jgi:hypothetical protein